LPKTLRQNGISPSKARRSADVEASLAPRSPALVDGDRKRFVRVLTALKKKGSLASPESLGAFVNAVCNNVLLETYRSNGRTSALDDDMDEPEADRPSAEWRVLKSRRARQGARGHRRLAGTGPGPVRWLFFEDRNKDDVCRELQVDRDYLRVLFHRAKHASSERFSSGEQQT
jgi:RNA polymerase sigma-70 factor (ECF subfamily)